MKNYAACSAFKKAISNSELGAFAESLRSTWRRAKLWSARAVGARDVPVLIEKCIKFKTFVCIK